MDTIFALASARGKSGVAVVRISGSRARQALAELTVSSPDARQAKLAKLSYQGSFLDQALILAFDAPHSFTGEDVVELHLHGSVATVKAVLSALSNIEGLRPADAGEFTRRALENDQLDLAQVEGLADLVEAETEAQRRQALAIFSGQLGDLAQSWRTRLIRAAALMEATIDFADEEVPVNVFPEVNDLLSGVTAELTAQIAGADVAERVRDGFEVAIVGPPNVGKSTLLNALAGRDAAITSEIAGTTRDVIEVRMDLRGLPVTMLDTAGMRDSDDAIETIGIDRARQRSERADLRIVLKSTMNEDPVVSPGPDDIVAVSKSDVSDGDISAITGSGINELIERVASTLESRASGASSAIRSRHKFAMERAVEALGIAQSRITSDPDLAEIIAEDLRTAIRALDSLVGRVDVENLLDEIFSSFCIGK